MLLDLWHSFWPGYFPFYRASQDARNGLPNDGPALQHYIMCWLTVRAVNDREANS